MNLGMSIWDIRKLILVENGLIAAASIVLGILSGTVFSRIFFLIITKLIGLTDISFHISFNSYTYSIGIFAGVFLLAVFYTLVTTGRYDIERLLKSDRIVERSVGGNPFLAVVGIAILLASLVVLYKRFNGEGELLLLCTVGFMAGLYITISELGGAVLRIMKKRKDSYYNNIILMTNLSYKFKQTKRIVFAISIMTLVSIFINGFYLSLVLSAEKIAVDNNPFDIAFVQMLNSEDISREEISRVINESEPLLKERKAIEFTIIDRQPIIAQNQLNSVCNSSFNVSRGSYIKLIQINEYSEEEKKELYNNEMMFPNQGILASYKNQEYIFKRLFNGPEYMFTHCIILNDEEYNSIKSNNPRAQIGNLHLLNCKAWKETQPLVNSLQEALTASKGSTTQQGELNYSLKVSSKVGTYNENKQGTKILFWLLALLGVFFFIATSLVLFLRLFSELDSEKAKYKKLHKIGITEDEIRKSIGREFIAIFFTGPIIGIIAAIVYTLAFGRDNQTMTQQVIGCNLIISAIFLVFEVVYFFIARNFYCNEIVEGL